MIQAMSAPQNKGQQPQPNQNPGAFFWFLGFVLVCAFVLINLYVGVIFSQVSLGAAASAASKFIYITTFAPFRCDAAPTTVVSHSAWQLLSSVLCTCHSYTA
jgi:hypothetical protein